MRRKDLEILNNLMVIVQLSGFRLGKDKKSKSAGYTQRETMDDYGFVTPSGQSVDVESIAEYEVSERFEQMLVSLG